jgi:hypothetical protein
MFKQSNRESGRHQLVLETISVRKEGGVLFAELASPPMNLLGPELVGDLVSLIRQAEGDLRRRSFSKSKTRDTCTAASAFARRRNQ